MSLTLNSRPVAWAGTSNPILYKFTTTDQAQAGYFLQVEIWDSTLAAKVADAKYYPTSAGALSVDVSGFLSSQMSLDNNSDLTSGTVVFTDNNWIKYYIKYRQVWTGSIPAYTDDVANLRFAIYGGLQVGVINDFINYTEAGSTVNYVTIITKLLSLQNTWTAIKNYPFTFSFYMGNSGSLKIARYLLDAALDTTSTSISSIGIGRGKIKETGLADKIKVWSSAGDGATWTSRTSAADNTWNSVCFGSGPSVFGSYLFVAVSQDGANRVMTSPDGITWTSRAASIANQWRAVCFGNGLFVAVANSGTGTRVMTSPDGLNWTTRTSAADISWYSVTYGNGLFVAVSIDGVANCVMTSPDGITWTIRSAPAPYSWNSVCFGNGLFVAVSPDGTGRVMTSADGITWTIRLNSPSQAWVSVCFGNGLFVAVAETGTGNRVMTSIDGINWTSRTSAADLVWESVVFGSNLFVATAITGTGNRVMTSPDGITWTSRTSAADNNWYSITFGLSQFVAVSKTGVGNRVMTSPHASSEIKTINILEECSNIVNLQWKNSLGGDECYPFKYSQEYTHDLGNGRKARRATLYAENLTLNQWEAIQGLNTPGDIYRNTITELLTTTNRTASKVGQAVYILNSDGSKIGVVVINQNNKTQTHQRVHRAVVTIEYPEIFLQ